MGVTFHNVKLKSINSFSKTLGMHRYFEYEHQIISGLPSRRLAKILQSEGHYLEIKMESLAQKIRSYRREVILPKARRLIEFESTTNISNADKALSENRNIAFELGHLIEIQQSRVNKGIAIEHDDDEIYAYVSREIRLLCNLLNTYGQFQIKAGLIKSVGHPTYYYHNNDPETEKHIQGFLDNIENQRQLSEASQKALKLLNEIDPSEINNIPD